MKVPCNTLLLLAAILAATSRTIKKQDKKKTRTIFEHRQLSTSVTILLYNNFTVDFFMHTSRVSSLTTLDNTRLKKDTPEKDARYKLQVGQGTLHMLHSKVKE